MLERFSIGDFCAFDGIPVSKIIGIDRYTLYSHTGIKKSWVSYTLQSETENQLYSRWWLTDENEKLYAWTPLEDLPKEHGVLDLAESGICLLDSQGDQLIESSISSVLVYQLGSDLYCSEVFNTSTEVLYMQGKLLKR